MKIINGTIFHAFSVELNKALAALPALAQISPQSFTKVSVEPPRDPSHGDLSTNAAMVLAKEAKTNPRALGEALAQALQATGFFVKVEVAGPGFVNITLPPTSFEDVLRQILTLGADYGRASLGLKQKTDSDQVFGSREKVNVEYVSANPTGPMHVGHGRGAVYGDALANLLAFAGWDVTREYYINDAGAQVDVLARSAFHRYLEALGRDVGKIGEGLYPGDYLIPVGQKLAADYGTKLETMAEVEWLPLLREAAITAMMALIREDLAALAVHHDYFASEIALQRPQDKVGAMLADFEARNLIYRGHLPPPKGQKDEDWEDREQSLFRATDFGDDVDRPLLKADGGYTYFASDIAYHADKFARGFAYMIGVWGADHGGYVKRMQAAVKAATKGGGAA